MAANLKRRYTLEEYLELDEQSEARLEFHDGEIFDMSGGSIEHCGIEMNLAYVLATQVRERGCRVLLGRMRIKVPSAPPYRYGDLSALCGKAEFTKIGGVDTLINPSLIVEVLSRSTEKYDRDIKFKQYQSIPSLTEYVLVAQDVAFVTHYVKGDGGWIHHGYDTLTDVVKLESLGCEITLAEIYRNVELSEYILTDPEVR